MLDLVADPGAPSSPGRWNSINGASPDLKKFPSSTSLVVILNEYVRVTFVLLCYAMYFYFIMLCIEYIT